MIAPAHTARFRLTILWDLSDFLLYILLFFLSFLSPRGYEGLLQWIYIPSDLENEKHTIHIIMTLMIISPMAIAYVHNQFSTSETTPAYSPHFSQKIAYNWTSHDVGTQISHDEHEPWTDPISTSRPQVVSRRNLNRTIPIFLRDENYHCPHSLTYILHTCLFVSLENCFCTWYLVGLKPDPGLGFQEKALDLEFRWDRGSLVERTLSSGTRWTLATPPRPVVALSATVANWSLGWMETLAISVCWRGLARPVCSEVIGIVPGARN